MRLIIFAVAWLVYCLPATALQSNWDRCISSVLVWEGGWTGPRKQEPGGYAMRGISYQTFKQWRSKLNLPDPSPDDLKNISLDETKQIYDEQYGRLIGFSELPAGYDCAALHGAVMFGAGEGTDDRPGMTRLNREAKGDTGLLIALMMRAKMYRPDCGPTKNEQTGKPMWLCKGWADRFVAVYGIAKELSK